MSLSPEALKSRLKRLRHVVLDMDGTIYAGQTLFPFTLPFLRLLAELGIGHTFLTNNSSKSTQDYLEHLSSFGISATREQLYTSTQATIQFLRRSYPAISRVFVLGTSGMSDEMAAAGFALTRDDAEDEPQAVIVGFDTALCFSRLCRAAYWIKAGKPFIATHPDRICPTDQPTVLVDCGSICAALTTATGRAASAVLGKPDPAMLTGILERNQLASDELAMIGDRLYTDMAMARQAGALGVVVLTGETTSCDVAAADADFDLAAADLATFGQMLRAARR